MAIPKIHVMVVSWKSPKLLEPFIKSYIESRSDLSTISAV